MRHLLFVALCAFPLFAQEPGAAKPQDPTPPRAAPADAKGGSLTGPLDEKEFAALHDLKQEKSPKPTGIAVKVGDAAHYLALPKTGEPPFPALVVIHEWWGLNDHIRHWADRLAADGYAALAVDLYGGKAATTREEAMAAMKAVEPAKAEATLRAAFAFLQSDSRVRATKRGSLGWCFGGMWSLRLAIAEPELDAAVVYYGQLVTDPKALAAIRAPVLGVFGDQDGSIPPKAVDAFAKAMQEAGRELKVLRYDAKHAFANPSAAAYDAENAAKAWVEVRAFLAQHLKGEKASAKEPAKSPEEASAPRTGGK